MAVPVISSKIGARSSGFAFRKVAKLPCASSIDRVKRSKSIPVTRFTSSAESRNFSPSGLPVSMSDTPCWAGCNSPSDLRRARCWLHMLR